MFIGNFLNVIRLIRYIYPEPGPATLAWVIEVARKVIAAEYKPKQLKCVQQAIAAYREANNWLQEFLNERCDVSDDLEEGSGALYDEYRRFCEESHDYTRHKGDFYAALESRGFERKRKRTGSFIHGLKLKREGNPGSEDNFLPI